MSKLPFEPPLIRRLKTGMPGKAGMIADSRPVNQIDGIKVDHLADSYGSPLFVISERMIRNTFYDARSSFEARYPKVQFAWSYKTNYLDAVCRIFHQQGSWAEVVSRFEYDKALTNGVAGENIIINGPDKTADDLKFYVGKNSFIHIDNFDELYDLLEVTSQMEKIAHVAIRVNMDTGIYPAWQRFGFNYENGEAWQAINRIMQSKWLKMEGLHCHIGTYITSPDAYAMAATKLTDLALQIRTKFNHYITYIDMGGGFASRNTLKGAYLPGTDTCPSFDEYADAITPVLLKADFDPDHLPLLILETGRALIDEAGYLISTVRSVKRLPDGRRATIIDAGVNLLFTSFWYDHKIAPVHDTGSAHENMIIYGPLCMNIDVIRDNINLPLMKKGDKVVITRTGAYNMTQWMQFITYRPNIVLIDDKGNTHIIRKAENAQTHAAFEIIPDYLK